ncbi:type III secretion system effector protein [Paracidovorax cattleyae]|uniref:Uncharacterized protein n=1 Tax=Paracidovorax cattleyae TaxID=80868 RepID=A0A1H0LCA7_9BURK|nr:type III secretion system effector protein [Paracidovorax cattleyae]SDO65818.1 hypothetical protein SAMN04489708_102140 [Paracidovorax cattleyae]
MDNNIISHRASGRMSKLQSPVSDAEVGQGKPDTASASNAPGPLTGLHARATDYGPEAAVRPRVSLASATGAAESGTILDLEAGITEPQGTVQVERGGAIASTPAARLVALQRMQVSLATQSSREVNPQMAVDLVNRLRPLMRQIPTHSDLMREVSETDVRAWYGAQGLDREDVDALRRSAFLSGLPNPTGSFMNNALQYIVSPWVNYATGDPWAGAGIGFGTAAIAAPMNALQQSAVVTLCESLRERHGPVIVPDKKNINDRHWLPELSKALEHEVVQFSALHDRLRATLAEHGIQADQGGPPDAVLAALSGLTREARQELHLQVRQWLDSEKKLHRTHGEFLMTQGAHERQWMGNRWQFVPRTLRSPAASLLGLVGKSGAARVLPPTLQVVASLMLTAAQHVAAGFDERAKQEYNNVLNLLYGQFFTASGTDKLARGQPLEADDIDTAKLRGFISMPVQSLVKRVSADVGRQVTTLRELLADRPPAVGQGDTDSRASDRAALAGMENDAALLGQGRLSELDPDGLAQSLLLASEKSVISEQLLRDLVAKYTVKEFSAQTAQRLGQAFHLGVFGSAASSIIGKVTSAASGGTRQAPVAQTVGVSVLSGVMAAIGASNQHTAISVKNNRREGEVDVGLGRQVLRGVMGGLSESLAQRRGSRAGLDMKALLAQDQVGNLLGFAKSLNQQLSAEFEVAPEILSLSEAGRVLGPGHTSAAGATEIVIEMDPNQATSGMRLTAASHPPTSAR